jgi:hypothetical protein
MLLYTFYKENLPSTSLSCSLKAWGGENRKSSSLSNFIELEVTCWAGAISTSKWLGQAAVPEKAKRKV